MVRPLTSSVGWPPFIAMSASLTTVASSEQSVMRPATSSGKPARRDLWGRILVSRTHPRYDPIHYPTCLSAYCVTHSSAAFRSDSSVSRHCRPTVLSYIVTSHSTA
jgi:hypothetical protein